MSYNDIISRRSNVILIVVFSYLFALSWTIPLFVDSTPASAFVVALIFVVPLAFLASLLIAVIKTLRQELSPSSQKLSLKIFVAVLISLLVCWGITFLVMYPGICTNDSTDILKMIWGMPFESDHFRYDGLNNHHPAFYVFLVYLALQLGSLLGLSQAMSVGLVSLLHMITLALCCAYFTSRIHALLGSRIMLALCWLFFFFNPLIAQYSVTVWKDIVFSGIFLVFLVELFVLVLMKEQFFSSKLDPVVFTTASIMCVLLRSNALPAIGVAFIVALCVCKPVRKQLAKVAGIVALVCVVVLGPLYAIIGIQPGHFVEGVSIPLQQVSRVLAEESDNINDEPENANNNADLVNDDADLGNSDSDFGNDGSDLGNSNSRLINDEQERFFDELLPIELYGQNYNPAMVDNIKFLPDFDDDFLEAHKGTFFLYWWQLGLQNPDIYARAWCDQTKPFWNAASTTWYVAPPGYSLADGEEKVSRNLIYGLIDYEDLSVILQLALEMGQTLYNMAWLAWFVLFSCLALFCLGEKKYLICMAPLVVWWITLLIAAPATDFRYMFPVHLAVPFVVSLLFFFAGKGDNQSSLQKPVKDDERVA